MTPNRAVFSGTTPCPLAVPIIGGMVSSTWLTLIVIPAIYAVVKEVVILSSRLAPPLNQPATALR